MVSPSLQRASALACLLPGQRYTAADLTSFLHSVHGWCTQHRAMRGCQVLEKLRVHMAANPGMRLQLVGHSMGGGCAAILTMM